MAESVPGYVLREPLGQGSAAVVWRAEPAGSPGRVVAVKRLQGPAHPEAVEDLRREADALERLSHPSILRLLEVVADGDGVALVVPYAPGGSLADRIAASPEGLPPAEVADLAARLGGALAASHNLGLVHRDVKPVNILFDAEAQPLLADFGTARLLEDRAAISGTAEYLAPEVADGNLPDARSDVYGLGVTCYEALTGTPPYAASSPQATLRAAARGHHVPLADLVDAPAALIDAVEAAMARDPERRPATAAELAGRCDEALRELQAGSGGAQMPPGGADVLGAPRASAPASNTPPPPPPPQAPEDDSSAPHPGTASPAAAPPDSEPALRTLPAAEGASERSGTQLFGPAPPRPQRAPGPERKGVDRRLLVAAAAAAVLVPIGVVGYLVLGGGDEPDAGAEGVPEIGASSQPTEREPAEPCPDVEAPTAAGDDLEVVAADVAGRGCSVPVGWDGETLTMPRADDEPRRYQLDAEPDDQLLFGDWACDGHEAPALYRPDDGRVFVFEGFVVNDDEVTVDGEPTGVVDGDPRVLVDDDGCHELDVQ